MAPTALEMIVRAHRAKAAADERDFGQLMEAARELPAPREFGSALRSDHLSVIAEVKRRSPSAGDLNTALDPLALAGAYEAGGASCLSVLTDEEFFGGSVSDLQRARSSVSLPVLRKDFAVDARDIVDARLMGADAILLIVAALDDDELLHFHQVADELSLTALVEVHDAEELERAQGIGAEVIGVNQRNLHTFEIDPHAAEKLVERIDRNVLKVAESGIVGVEQAQRVAAAGYDAVLVASALVTSGDPSSAVRSLASVEVTR